MKTTTIILVFVALAAVLGVIYLVIGKTGTGTTTTTTTNTTVTGPPVISVTIT